MVDEQKIDKAIEKQLELAVANPTTDQALKFSQSALNLAHVKAITNGVDKNPRAGAK